MGENKKVLYIAIAVIVIVTTILLGVVEHFKLDEPVFVESFYDYSVYLSKNKEYMDDFYGYSQSMDDEYDEANQEELSEYYLYHELYLKYITNKEDDRGINDVQFVDHPEIMVDVEAPNYYVDQTDFMNIAGVDTYAETYGRYRIQPFRLVLKAEYDQIPDKLNLSKALITYNDGESKEINLGKIFLSCEELDDKNNPLESITCATGDNFNSTKYRVKRNIILDKIDTEFLSDNDHIKVNGYDGDKVNGLAFPAGEELKVEGFYNGAANSIYKYCNVELRPKIYYRDIEGNKYSEQINYIYQTSEWFSIKEIYSYLKGRGEL